MYNGLRIPNRNVASTAAIAFLAMSATAEGKTGGTSFGIAPPAPAVKQLDSNGACPKVENISSKTKISNRCQSFLLKTLRNSVYDSADPAHAKAAYQAVANLKHVDGIAGPETTRSILKGKALRPRVPDTRFTRKPGVLVDKSDQVAYIMEKNKYTGKSKVSHILKVSTGTEQPYTATITNYDGTTSTLSAIGDTPTGDFVINRIEGPGYTSSLGAMPYARFINHPDGIALHSGYVDINGRDSHGCLRVPPADMTGYMISAVAMRTLVTIRE